MGDGKAEDGAARWQRLLQETAAGHSAGIFIPHRAVDRLDPEAALPSPALTALFEKARPRFAEALARLPPHLARLAQVAGPAPAPRLDQDWFPRLDGAMAYALTRRFRPRRIVEIGGGHSSRLFRQALEDAGHGGSLTVIDYAARRGLAALAADPAVRLIETDLQNAAPHLFAALGPGDFLSLDASHILVPGSDADLFFTRILPGLPAGVIVHIHDVFLPDPYPPAWRWRGYNEQSAVALLLLTQCITLVFASHFVVTRMKDAFAAAGLNELPLADGAWETSLWAQWRGPHS